jgi:hypothetical protein
VSNRRTSKSAITNTTPVFEKLIPAALIALGAVMVVLILFALGVLLGLVNF